MDNNRFFTQIITLNGEFRSKKLSNILDLQGIKYSIANGFLISDEDFESEKYHNKKISKLITQRNISKNEVGCAMAHMNATRLFLNSSSPFGIIFEDDAEINAVINLDSAENFLDNSKPRILFFGWLPGYAVSKTTPSQPTTEIIPLLTPPTCAFAYAINRPAAKLLANFTDLIIDLADWPIQIFYGVEFGAVSNPIVSAPQNPELSTIGRRIEQDKKSFSLLRKRINLATSIVNLFIQSKHLGLNLTFKQIFHRIILKDLVYKNGNKYLAGKVAFEPIVFTNSFLGRIISLFYS